MKRIALFVATNIAVLVVLSIIAKLFGLDAYLAARGESLTGLLVLSALFGFGGAFISRAVEDYGETRHGVQVIEVPRNDTERWLFETVRAHARRLDVGMPEIDIFDSPTMNAFATGASRDRALVAVSTGLLRGMN